LSSYAAKIRINKRLPGGRPSDNGGLDRPNLAKSGFKFRRKSPTVDDARDDPGTHDVNDEMLADAYRRGLRVKAVRRTKRYTLGFFLGE
jgi:hypothetical protein